MQSKEKTEKLFISKLLFTIMIISIYAFFRHIPLYGVDVSAYENIAPNTDILLQHTVGGDYFQYSIMALGISPYMIATILTQLMLIFRTKEAKARTSPIKINRISLFVTVALSISMAISRADNLIYLDDSDTWFAVKIVVIIEMLTGALLMVWFAGRNKRYGIGGQGTIFLVNLIDNTMRTLGKYDFDVVAPSFIVGMVLMLFMIYLENLEKHIPLQRISIHNIYADKNYQAIKFNPIGIMPVMFASAFFLLPQLIVNVLQQNFPNNITIAYWQENMTLGKPLGIIVYIVGIYILNIGFAFIMLNPKDMMEQFLKSGDSFVGIHPGKYTRRYIRRNLFVIGFLSSTVLSGCISISFYMTLYKGTPSDVAMISTSIMMLAGLACTAYQEAKAVISTDSYKTFI